MDTLPLSLRDILLMFVVLAAVYLVFVLFKLMKVRKRPATRQKTVAAESEPVSEPERSVELPPDIPPRPRYVFEPPAPTVDLVAMEPMLAPVPATLAARHAIDAYAENAEPQAMAAREQYAAPLSQEQTFEWDEVKSLFGETEAQPTAAVTGTDKLPISVRPAKAPAKPGGFGEHIGEHLARTDMENEIQRMRDEMGQMREELEELRAARRVSPQYAEAMEMAQRGMSARDVAERLGMSLAEAELVQALGRGKLNFD